MNKTQEQSMIDLRKDLLDECGSIEALEATIEDILDFTSDKPGKLLEVATNGDIPKIYQGVALCRWYELMETTTQHQM